eukprot:1628-Prymnesium_polylepis.1
MVELNSFPYSGLYHPVDRLGGTTSCVFPWHSSADRCHASRSRHVASLARVSLAPYPELVTPSSSQGQPGWSSPRRDETWPPPRAGL